MKRPKWVFLFLAGSEFVYLYVCLWLLTCFDSISDRYERSHKDRAVMMEVSELLWSYCKGRCQMASKTTWDGKAVGREKNCKSVTDRWKAKYLNGLVKTTGVWAEAYSLKEVNFNKVMEWEAAPCCFMMVMCFRCKSLETFALGGN